jgi:hypothetical protein
MQVVTVIAVVIAIGETPIGITKFAIDSALRKVDWPIRFVLVFHENVRTDGASALHIAAAGPVGGIMNVALPCVVRRLRIRAQRT